MARYAARYYHNVTPEDMKWILVEASGRILPEVGEELGRYTVTELRRRNIDVRLDTRLESCADRVAVLSDGSRFPTRTVVWTAGVKPHPVLASTDLPLDDRGRLTCTAHLSVDGAPHAWAAGDAAAVPDVTAAEPGRECAPNAQHAVRQAKVLGDNVTHALRGEPLDTYAHRYAGSVASLGFHKGVAHVYGRKVKGYPAWFMHRAYHLSRVPTVNRKARVLAEWVIAGLFKREIVSRVHSNIRGRSSNSRPVESLLRSPRTTRRGRPDRTQELPRPLGRLTDVGRAGTLPDWSTTAGAPPLAPARPPGPGPPPARPGPRPPTTTRGKDS
ncbi:hypothetical protein STENM327S_00207 [Streptomyces tendae]